MQKQGKTKTNYGVAGPSFAAVTRLQDKIVNNLHNRGTAEKHKPPGGGQQHLTVEHCSNTVPNCLR